MIVKNLTPFAFATKVCSRKPPQPEMTLVVRGRFTLRPGEALAVSTGELAQGSLTAERFHAHDEDRTGECLYGGDLADFKLNAEVLLKGTCHVPEGKPATECPAAFRVGAWSKILRVVGPRTRLPGGAISSPTPFTKMPILYENAFGGPGYAKNPVGKGFGTPDLPTVQGLADMGADHPEPGGFGPINPAWPQRAGKMGKAYGASYKGRAPYFAEDFDWTYFQCAPPDQQIEGYLVGDEDLMFQNLHPTVQVFDAKLPGIRIRAFMKAADGSFREIPMVLDTLFVDAESERANLTWRGLVAVREDDLADVSGILIAAEGLAAAREPETHYRAIFDAFERDPVGLEERYPPGFKEASERWRKQRAGEPVPPDPSGEGLDPISRMIRDRMGPLEPELQAKVAEAMKAKLDPRVDLEAEAKKASAAADDHPPLPRIAKPGFRPDVGIRRRVRELMAQVAKVKKSLEGKEIPEAERKRLEALDQIPFDPGWQRLDPDYTPPLDPISSDEPGPGRDLSEQDLTGRDLRGLDLTGANLESAILTRADLRGAKLGRANLQKAILFRADLSGADLTGADLTRANAAQVRALGAIFRGTKLNLAYFERAHLAGSILREAEGEYTVFAEADLEAVEAKRVTFTRADFTKARLDRADFSSASLASCDFSGSRGAVVMTGADLSHASFDSAQLAGSVFADARASDSIWRLSTVDGADFSYAKLRRCLLDELSAVEAIFFGADLRESRLYRAKLDRARFIEANLFEANLEKAIVNGTKFNDSSLYAASFLGASGAGADFNGANLKRSTLENA